MLGEQAAEGALGRPVDDDADVAAVGRRRGEQHGLAILEVAERGMRDQQNRVVLALRVRRAAQREKTEKKQKLAHDLSIARRVCRAPSPVILPTSPLDPRETAGLRSPAARTSC